LWRNKVVIMDDPFIYSKFVTGKNFIGRSVESKILENFIKQGENVYISEPPKCGKASLIQQTFFSMKSSGDRFSTISISLLGIRSIRDFALQFGSALIRSLGETPDDFSKAAGTYLDGTHFIFDLNQFNASGSILSLNWDIDDNDLLAIFRLPWRIAADRSINTCVILNEFQNIMLTEDGDHICKLLETVFKGRQSGQKAVVSYIFIGSQINAMNYIFGIRRYFYRQVERVKLGEIETREIIDHVVRGYLASGKVVDRDLLLGVCKLFRNNIWYINHFAAICDSLTKGYIMEPALNEALEVIISIHEPRFISTMNDLTTYQVNLLHAILDGNTRFSSADVIRKYDLSSSANVRRLKDALCKKEIVFFDENSNPSVIDPLFEYWAGKYFYNINYE
jgi:hypothetical protein